MTVDIYRGNTVLGLHMDGTNTSTTVTDICGHAMTAFGNAQISTAQSKFGGASCLFDGTGDYVSTPDSVDWAFGSGDFTIEAWVRPANFSAAMDIMAQRNSAVLTDLWGFRIAGTTGALQFYANAASTSIISRTTTATLTAAAWSHVAAVRSSGATYLYINGSPAAATGADSSIALADTAALLYIGCGHEAAVNPFNGYIDDVRITKGVARYTGSFTPPTAAFGDELPSPIIQLTAPTPALKMYGGGFVSMAPPTPALTIFAGGGGLAISAPMQTIYSTGHSSEGENALIFAPPTPLLVSYGGSNAELTAPTPTLSATATVVALANTTIDAPAGRIAATATVSEMVGISITSPMARLIGYSGAVCSITLTGAPTIQATGTMGGVAQIAITAPLFQLESTATAQNHGSLLITAPMGKMVTGAQAYIIAPMSTLTAIGTATVTATYEAYATNLSHSNPEANDEVTHYTNFPFTHIVRYKNSYYGANSTGLYLLEGTTDNGTPIGWAFKTGMSDFDKPNLKTVTYAYFGGRLGPAATVSIYPSEPTGTSYSYITPLGQTAQNYRKQFGRGLKARYFAIGASGSDALELDSIDLTVATLTRRI